MYNKKCGCGSGTKPRPSVTVKRPRR